jgi:hypothetical protein
MQKKPEHAHARKRIQPVPVGHHHHTSNGGNKNDEGRDDCEEKGMIASRPLLHRFQVIWAAITSGYAVNVREFAEQLETSTKTIHRDIEFMRDRLGFEIHYDASHFCYVQTSAGRCPFCSPSDILKRYAFRHRFDTVGLIEALPPEQREEEIDRLRAWLFKREESTLAASTKGRAASDRKPKRSPMPKRRSPHTA